MKEILRTWVQLFDVMPRGAKAYYIRYSTITGLLALLDSIALALVMIVVTPVSTGGPVNIPVIGTVSSAMIPWIILLICAIFILKSLCAIALHWRATRRFARYELEVGDRLFKSYTHSSWEERSRLSTAEVTRLVDLSMANTNLGFIIPISQVPGNVLTFLSVLAVLLIAQPLTAVIAFVYLSLIAIVMILVVSRKSQLAGKHDRDYGYRVATLMTEMVDALKEVTLRGKLDEIGHVVSRQRLVATRARANVSFLKVVPIYAFEAALIGGFLLIGAASFLSGGMGAAIVSITLFAAAGFRMIPAMSAMQASLTSASANLVYARDVVRNLEHMQAGADIGVPADTAVLPKNPGVIEFREVSFSYAGTDRNVLQNLSLTIPFGSSLAIVGPSGAGKSTLIDIILGLSVPTSGDVYIDGIPLRNALTQWRQKVGYVPQRVALFDGTIAQNVALTWEQDYDLQRVEDALDRAHLTELSQRDAGLLQPIGEHGDAISGGQQQRMGIARALYSDPLVMVMDEATSSLDTATEGRITESMQMLEGKVTFITVAHRLATIRDYDRVCYLDRGMILGSGTFEEVVEQVPEFREQAKLAGLY